MRPAGISYRRLELEDVDAICQLMKRVGASIAGLKTRKIYETICCDALSGNNVVFLLADKEKVAVGCVIAITDWRYYWQKFLIIHPLIAVRILTRRFWRKVIGFQSPRCSELKRRTFSRDGLVQAGFTKRSWSESSSAIAKTLFVGVDQSSRRAGVGVQLYLNLFEELSRLGVKRIDANLSIHNIPSIRLHQKTGWIVERAGKDSLFATRNIE